jgi:hypothetical protein
MGRFVYQKLAVVSAKKCTDDQEHTSIADNHDSLSLKADAIIPAICVYDITAKSV